MKVENGREREIKTHRRKSPRKREREKEREKEREREAEALSTTPCTVLDKGEGWESTKAFALVFAIIISTCSRKAEARSLNTTA